MILPSEQTLTIGGVEYKLSKFTMPMFQEFLAWTAEQLPDPYKGVSERIKGMDKELAKYVIDLAEAKSSVRGTANDPDAMAMAETLPGLQKIFSLMFRKYHPSLSYDEVAGLVEAGIAEHGEDAFVKCFPKESGVVSTRTRKSR